MATFELLVEVRRREGIADPEGATVQRALPALGFDSVRRVRMGRAIRVEVEAPDEPSARAVGISLAGRLLSNPVMEDSEILACRALVSRGAGEAEGETTTAGAGTGRSSPPAATEPTELSQASATAEAQG